MTVRRALRVVLPVVLGAVTALLLLELVRSADPASVALLGGAVVGAGASVATTGAAAGGRTGALALGAGLGAAAALAALAIGFCWGGCGG